AFRHPRPAIFRPAASCHRAQGRLVRAWSSDWRLEPPDPTPLLTRAKGRHSEPPGSGGHLPSFQDAGHLHVDIGWAHPRPVAANDAPIVSASLATPGIVTGSWLGSMVNELPTAGEAPGAILSRGPELRFRIQNAVPTEHGKIRRQPEARSTSYGRVVSVAARSS